MTLLMKRKSIQRNDVPNYHRPVWCGSFSLENLHCMTLTVDVVRFRLLPFDQLERAEPDLFEAIMVETHGVL